MEITRKGVFPLNNISLIFRSAKSDTM